MIRHPGFGLKIVILLVSFVAFFCARNAWAATGPAAIDRKAPAFELDGLSGESIELSTFAGHPLYINVFATWCPPCRIEMPLIARTLPQYAKHVAFLAVDAQEGSIIVRRYLSSVGVKAHVAIDDGQFVASYGARSIPDSIFIDRAGIVRAIVRGPIDEPTLRKNLTKIAK